MQQIKEEKEIFDGYQSSRIVSKTTYSSGLSEVVFVMCAILLVVPIAAFIFSGTIIMLRQLQTPQKCSVSLTTRYAVELGRLSNG